jgi:hypothetical protein
MQTTPSLHRRSSRSRGTRARLPLSGAANARLPACSFCCWWPRCWGLRWRSLRTITTSPTSAAGAGCRTRWTSSATCRLRCGAWWGCGRCCAPCACGPSARQLRPWPGCSFGGLWVTTAVSAAYHLQPDDAGLVWDRAGMVLAFAGLLGLAAMQAVSSRAGMALAAAVLVLGPLSVHAWSLTGNVLPWAVLQFGGMALILGCLHAARPGAGAAGSLGAADCGLCAGQAAGAGRPRGL